MPHNPSLQLTRSGLRPPRAAELKRWAARNHMRITSFVATCLLQASAFAQSTQLTLPSPQEIGRAYSTVCAMQAQSAKLAKQARDDGASLQDLVSRLPTKPDSSFARTSEAFRETLEDSFAFPDLGMQTLFFYRASVCFRELTELRRLPRLKEHIESVAGCQREHGQEATAGLLRCLRDAVDRIPTQ